LDRSGTTRLNVSAGIASVAVALILVAAKAWAWAETGALSVAASLIDSALDLLVSLANFAAILYAAKPADEDHRFGHHSIEDIAALGQALMVAGAALALGWQGIVRLAAPEPLAAEGAGIAVMVFSIGLTAALVWWQRRVARATGSKVVAADSLHYLSDMLPAAGGIAALAASALLGVVQLDSAISLVAAAVLLHGAWKIGGDAFAALMDRAAPEEVEARIAAVVREFPEVAGFHDLKTRVSGARTFVQLHIELDGGLTLNDAHAIGARLRLAILEAVPGCEVLIHKDPIGDPFREPDGQGV
jgi:ferrous-iron efflux pump FieF